MIIHIENPGIVLLIIYIYAYVYIYIYRVLSSSCWRKGLRCHILPHDLQETVDLVKQIDGHSRLVDVSHAAFVCMRTPIGGFCVACGYDS